ncbi:MAG: hypothetical protein COA78_01695 [Blastopirellula sp.]|nr:MAG: hypothetical protein COA78_01695 [Blastopirellula sp.]
MTTRRKIQTQTKPKRKKRRDSIYLQFMRMIVVEGAGILVLGTVLGIPIIGDQLPQLIAHLEVMTEADHSVSTPLSVITTLFKAD